MKTTVELTSFILRIFWFLYPRLKGRPFRLDEINNEENKQIAKDLVAHFLPDLKRIAKPKTEKATSAK